MQANDIKNYLLTANLNHVFFVPGQRRYPVGIRNTRLNAKQWADAEPAAEQEVVSQ